MVVYYCICHLDVPGSTSFRDLANPPLELQKKYSEIVKSFELTKDLQKNTLRNIQDMYESTMQKAFRGELNC